MQDVTRDQFIRWIMSGLLKDPGNLMQALSHGVSDRFTIASHSHADVLQFDLLLGCSGSVHLNNRRYVIRGDSAMIAEPGVEHGYDLHAGRDDARVFHIKLRMSASSIWARKLPLCTWMTHLEAEPIWISSFEQLTQEAVFRRQIPSYALASLMQVLCRWPSPHGLELQAAHRPDPSPLTDTQDPVQQTLNMLDVSLKDPPGIEQLAEQCGISERHLARQFKRRVGCTIHQYLDRQRLNHARQRLLHDHVTASQICDELGFASLATFSRWFRQKAGQSPREFRSDPHTL